MSWLLAPCATVLLTVLLLTPPVPAQRLSSDPALRFPINTTIGLVFGEKNITVSGISYFYYAGIPYASAARFQDPEPIARRDYATVAVTAPPRCPEWDSKENRVRGREEDCLHLSVFTRQAPGTPLVTSMLWPVIMVVTSDRFLTVPRLAPDFLVDKGVLVVTVSYRSGSLGFLSTGDRSAPGNYGLLDLEMALRWIQSNIEAFGGNPRQVTLLGHGAGAALVSYMLLNPRITGSGLVHRAVTMSGSALCPWASPLEYPMNQTRSLAAALGCDNDGADSMAMVECLRKEPFERIVTKQQELYSSSSWNFPPLVAPVVDDGLRPQPAVPMTPTEALQRGNVTRSIPLVSGVVTDEAALMFSDLYTQKRTEYFEKEGDHPSPSTIIEQLLPDVVKRVAQFCNHAHDIIALIRYYYFRQVPHDDTELLSRTMIQVMTDLFYNECHMKWSWLYREKSGAAVFAYVFAYKGRMSTLDSKISELSTLNVSTPVINALRRSISHGDDLQYAFNQQLLHNEDRDLQDEMARIWTEFARSGSTPRPGWNAVQHYAEYTNYLHIDRPSREERRYRDDAMTFLRYVMALAKKAEELPATGAHGRHAGEEAPPYELIMWILVGVAIFLFIAFILAAILFVRQKKKTTFVTR